MSKTEQIVAPAGAMLFFHSMKLSTILAPPTLDGLCINTLRFLAVDMVQKANSGHPGQRYSFTPVENVCRQAYTVLEQAKAKS